MNRKLSSLPPPPPFSLEKTYIYNTFNHTIIHESMHMKTLYKTVIKNTGNLDTINNSATNESKESDTQRCFFCGAKNWNN